MSKLIRTCDDIHSDMITMLRNQSCEQLDLFDSWFERCNVSGMFDDIVDEREKQIQNQCKKQGDEFDKLSIEYYSRLEIEKEIA